MSTRNDVEAWATGLPTDFLECRDFGHQWLPLHATYDRKERTYARTMRCRRCTAERHQSLDRYGFVVASRYTYPDHYLTNGLGRLDVDLRATVRLTSTLRALENDDV